MPQRLHVWPQPERLADQYRERSAIIEIPGGGRRTLWFRAAHDIPYGWSEQSDAFAVSTIVMAMQWGAPLHVHATVSPSLLRNLEEYQLVWRAWRPNRYRVVDLTADSEAEAAPAPTDDVISCFSGGVDGCFTAFRHARGHCGRQRRNLQAGLLIHGFDIPLSAQEGFASATANARHMLASLDLPLVTLATNMRELPLLWSDTFAASCAAAMSLFQPHFRHGLLASDERYDYLQPNASNPLTDPMFSSASFGIVNDGAGYTRVEKIDLIAQWPEALRHLRVCWEGDRADANCGRCEKCIRTILGFRVHGHPLPPCFGRDVTEQDIAALPPLAGPWLNEHTIILERALANRLGDEPWVKALDRKLRRNHWHFFWPRLRQRVALRSRVRRAMRLILGRPRPLEQK